MAAGERAATVATLVTAGVALSLVIEPPFVWAFVALLLVTVCLGTDQVLRRQQRLAQPRPSFAVFVVPSLLVLASCLFLRLPTVGRGTTLAVGLVLSGIVLAAALYAEYQTAEASGPRERIARNVLNLIAYVIAFALFSAIFAPKFRSLLSATAILVVSALISAELFRGAGRPEAHPMWVGVAALVMGQVTWALNYWVLGAFAGGAILLLVFYTLTGLVRLHLNEQDEPRLLSEHLLVAGVGLTAVVFGGLWLR